MPVFFIQSHRISNHTVTIDGPLLSHLSKSLRIREGENIWVGDEHRFRYRVRIDHLDQKSLQASILETIKGPPAPSADVVLAQAILKGDRMNWVIQKATELGVTGMIPLLSSRVIARPPARSGPNCTGTVATDRSRRRTAIGAMGVPRRQPTHDFVRTVQARSTRGAPVCVIRTKWRTKPRVPFHRSHVPRHHRTGSRPRRRMDAGRNAGTPRPTLSTHFTGQKHLTQRNRAIGGAEHPATSIGKFGITGSEKIRTTLARFSGSFRPRLRRSRRWNRGKIIHRG